MVTAWRTALWRRRTLDLEPPSQRARAVGWRDERLAGWGSRAMPIAWRGTVIQYAGRLHRAHPGNQDVLVYDYVDAELPVLRRMFAKRPRAYRSLGYELAETA